MERLLADAEKFSGVHYDISNLNDVYEAIHVVQGELHISGRTAEEAAEIIARTGRSSEEVYEQLGTTAEEASTTISGSFATMKSSWKNLLVGIADDNADVGKLVDDFVDSVVTVGGNIIPRIESILGGLGELIAQAANKLVPIVVQTIIDSLPKLIESGVNLIVALNAGIWSAIPKLVRAIPDIIMAIVRGFVSAWPQLRQAGVDLIKMVGDGIKSLASSAVSWGRDLIQNFIDALTHGITQSLPKLMEKAPEIVKAIGKAIIDNAHQMLIAAEKLLMTFMLGIVKWNTQLLEAGKNVAIKIKNAIVEKISEFRDAGAQLLEGLWNGISDKVRWLKSKVSGVVDKIKSWFTGKEGFDEHSPSKWADKVGAYVSEGLANGIDRKSDKVKKAAEDTAQLVYSSLKEWADRTTKYEELSTQEQIELWEEVQKQFAEGTKQYADVEDKLFDLRKQRLREQEQAEQEFRANVEAIYKTIDDIEKNYQTQLENRSKQIFDSYKLFEQVPERQKVSGQALIDNLSGQISTIEEFYSGLQELADRGVGADLVEDIRAMGPSAIDQLSALLSLSEDKLDEYATLYQEKQEFANSVAIEELKNLREETDRQIQENMDSLVAILGETVEQSQSWGIDLMQNFIAGIENMKSRLAETVTDVANIVKDYIGFSEPKKGPLSNFHTYAPDMMELFAQGIRDNEGIITQQINKSFDFGARTIDFAPDIKNANSVTEHRSAHGGLVGATSNGEQTMNVDFTLRLDDGTVLQKFAHRLRPYLNSEAVRAGGLLA